MKNNNTLIAISLSLMACILWSGNFVVARGVHEWMNPIGFAFWRWVVALVCILPLAAKHYRTNIVYFKQNPKPYILMGVIGVGIFNTLIYEAAHYTSANNIALLAATSPIWTLFLAGVLKFDELNRFKIAGIFIAFFGALTIILKGNYADIVHLKFNFGDLLVFIASWFWATYSILLKKKHPQMNSFFLMGLIVVFGLAVLTPFYAIEIYFKGFTPFSANALYAYLYVALAPALWRGIFSTRVFS